MSKNHQNCEVSLSNIFWLHKKFGGIYKLIYDISKLNKPLGSWVLYLPRNVVGIHGMHFDPCVVVRDGVTMPDASRRMCPTCCHLKYLA
jgi:hypothetical protein